MTKQFLVGLVVAVSAAGLLAQPPQEKKPVPKDSARISLSGCTKGYMFTIGPRMADPVTGVNLPPGTHLRMNGPKKLISDIDGYKSSMVSITGLVKKGQFGPGGVAIGGVHFSPAPGPGAGVGLGAGTPQPIQIDVEGWSPATGECPQ
jgi:hypothetical protein